MQSNYHPEITEIINRLSPSETHGIQAIPDEAELVYSAGTGSAGAAEIAMAALNSNRTIIASTIDTTGAALVRDKVTDAGFADQVSVTIEDISEKLPYQDDSFDFIYGRLVLHFLSKQQLQPALDSLHRVLRPGGLFYAVVRSVDCPDANNPEASLDEATGLTSWPVYDGKKDNPKILRRLFHTPDSITSAIAMAGFDILHCDQYDEQLYRDFGRRVLSADIDNIIEVLARKP